MRSGPDDEYVVTLDPSAVPIGTASKVAAHTAPGQAHLAFSVLLLDPAGEHVLLQRRARTSHHFRGAWSNSCCSHPRPGEAVLDGARRRTREELGLDVDGLRCHGAFWYEATDPATGLVEREYDVVVLGTTDGAGLQPDPAIVAEVRWVPIAAVREHPGLEPVTPWFDAVVELALGTARDIAPSIP